MSLFPAYALKDEAHISIPEKLVSKNDETYLSALAESQLLASDSEEAVLDGALSTPTKQVKCQSPALEEFYFDSKSDYGNLRVSTLYYPGRPEYSYGRARAAEGACGAGGAGARDSCKRRYFARRAPDEPDAPAVAQRAAAYLSMLAQTPEDVDLWEQYIDFQEACGGEEAALVAAEQAAARAPCQGRLRARLLDAERAARPPRAVLERLRALLVAERSPRARLELWERLLAVLPAEPGTGPDEHASVAGAALADTRLLPAAYPRLLHAHGAYLRSAGLWERLVLLVELVVGMNYEGAGFPPPEDAHRVRRTESGLVELEDRAAASGLPLSAVWVRVERARAAAHWRPAHDALEDPQRSPRAHDVADLLAPLAAGAHPLELSVRLLMLAKVPLLPATDWAVRAFGGHEVDAGEALLALFSAARALPPAHPARAPPAAARALLSGAVDPPHYFSDDTGFLSWVTALWDVLCDCATGEARVALACWRLRWLHSLLLLVGDDEEDGGQSGEEGARVASVRAEARALLRRLDSAPLAFAEFARIERLAAGRDRAVRVATHALRAALNDPACPRTHALYIARVLREVSAGAGRGARAGVGALACAVLGRAPLELAAVAAPDVAAALQLCEERCEALESELCSRGDEDAESACAALLPGAGEWARARALLAAPPRRRRLLRALGGEARACVGAAAARYYEESACALVEASAADGRAASVARAVAPLYPHNAYLQLASAGAPLWAWEQQSQADRLRALAPRSDTGALAAMLPALLRGARLPRSAAGTRGGARGALVWTLRLEAEARAGACASGGAALAAVAAAPASKWLLVRAAAAGGAAAELADALLERQLRAHALMDELRPPSPPRALL